LATAGLKVAVRVADCPGFRVSGTVIPVAPKSEPATEIPEMVTEAVPVDLRTIVWVAVCPMLTLPKLIVVLLRLRVRVLLDWATAIPAPFNPARVQIIAKI